MNISIKKIEFNKIYITNCMNDKKDLILVEQIFKLKKVLSEEDNHF
ncbi:hypothetical protein LEP1GSC037_0490 [Leptospira interrogans str. 2006001854]|uniref:Uncharacterized protein n=2 Tax=Leptospira interrogans TaxID=173 RepID=A0A0E2DEV4_LEPIR|nr:hypothetical protein LEP1GSC105_0615 [Leptospira interrogans str. UI 12758]EMM80251.1 hypothetical protein LEP1GSC037_0490 [Leptospira interrogans str. 2006001854]